MESSGLKAPFILEDYLHIYNGIITSVSIFIIRLIFYLVKPSLLHSLMLASFWIVNDCSALDGVVNLWEVHSSQYVLVFLLSLFVLKLSLYCYSYIDVWLSEIKQSISEDHTDKFNRHLMNVFHRDVVSASFIK